MKGRITKILNEKGNELLAHYTHFETALKIITSGKLMYNGFKAMNDISESYLPFFYSHFRDIKHPEEMVTKTQKELERYHLICLSEDGQKRCFAIPSMWGHYSDKGFGACLVFDKGKVVSLAHSDSAIPLTVNYLKELPDISFNSSQLSDIESQVRTNIKEWFCHKTNDWRTEQEFRIIKRIDEDCTDNHYLELGSALVCVIICKDESTEYGGTARGGLKYQIMRNNTPEGIPILVFENQLLSRKWGLYDGCGESTIWAE